MINQYLDRNGNIIDFYTIFNIPYNALEKDIKSAFHALIKRYHPDTSEDHGGDVTEKIDLIIHGYRILADNTAREEYDRHLFRTATRMKPEFPVIPKKRIKYSASLAEMLKARFLPRNLKHKDIIKNFGQDIEIVITGLEARRGAVAYITLPARMHCPLCAGRNAECHVCKGIGRIATTSQLEVTIPPGVPESTFIDVDLLKMKPDRLTTFRGKSIRIKITVAGR